MQITELTNGVYLELNAAEFDSLYTSACAMRNLIQKSDGESREFETASECTGCVVKLKVQS